MTRASGVIKIKPYWAPAWPVWAFLAFAAIALTRWLPAGYARAAVATPVLLTLPGALTLGAIFGGRRRPPAAGFVCCSALLSALWCVFASLILYMAHVLITVDSTYWCLLAVCFVLAAVAHARIRIEASLPWHTAITPDASGETVLPPASIRRAGYQTAAALAAGLVLLGGAMYSYDHLPAPAPAGYTWLSWTGPRLTGPVQLSAAGATLPFEIVHHQPGTASYQLRASWLGTTSNPLAGPLPVTVGPDGVFKGQLTVPPLPRGCVSRVVVIVTALHQLDPHTKQPRTWSINTDVAGSGTVRDVCES